MKNKLPVRSTINLIKVYSNVSCVYIFFFSGHPDQSGQAMESRYDNRPSVLGFPHARFHQTKIKRLFILYDFYVIHLLDFNLL